MKISKLTLVTTNLLLLLPLVAGLILWNQIPDRVPIHFDIHGHPDGWGEKAFAIIGFPLMMLVIQLMTQGIIVSAMKSDKRTKGLNSKIIEVPLWVISAVLMVAEGAVLFAAMGKSVEGVVGIVLPMLLGAMFVAIGNYLPKCKQNNIVGIRIPWTLADEDNWVYTHRLGGWSWTIGGLLMMLFAFLKWIVGLIVVFVLMNLIPIVASYLYSRRKRAK